MGLDLSLTAVPIQAKSILQKAIEKKDSEYPDILFHFPRVFQSDFEDFGHPDRIEFKKDAASLLKYYPFKKFEKIYYLETNRKYGVLDYLIAQHRNNTESTFFYDGIDFEISKGGQGHILKYWDQRIIGAKKALIDKIQYEDLIKHYDYKKMDLQGVYKISQINEQKDSIKTIFQKLKSFLINAKLLNGFVIVSKD